jgi:hypothetical protein
VYISRDVVFDEHIFPFAQLHPNAGARLQAELALLPDILKNSSTCFGDAKLHDQTLVNSMPSNVFPSSPCPQNVLGSNPMENGVENGSNIPCFMWSENDEQVTAIETDPPAPALESAATSTSGSPPAADPSQVLSEGAALPRLDSPPHAADSTAAHPDPRAATTSAPGDRGSSHTILCPDLLRVVHLWIKVWRHPQKQH